MTESLRQVLQSACVMNHGERDNMYSMIRANSVQAGSVIGNVITLQQAGQSAVPAIIAASQASAGSPRQGTPRPTNVPGGPPTV